VFGITKEDLQICRDKLENQKAYMLSHSFTNELGQPRTLLDCSFSANLSQKYYAEVSNRTNTLASFSILYNQVPVFLTVTLNGCFRAALKGDYSKFKAIDMKLLPYEIKYKIKKAVALTISDLVVILNHQWRTFFRRFNARVGKIDYSYIRCFEPHKKDGVPHIHALFYVPANCVKIMQEIYKKVFYAPQNLKTNAVTPEQVKNGEFNGFQTSINNPTGYVMKYIQKTFINLKETDELDELAAWYVKHKVRRFLSSRTKVPLWVYRKINFISSYQDFYHLNDAINDDENVLEWNKAEDYIYLNLPRSKEELIYLDGRLEHYIAGRLINSYDKMKPQQIKTPYRTDGKCPQSIDITCNILAREAAAFRREMARERGWFKKFPIQMKNWELYNYYQELDKKNCNIQHLALVENIMLDRGLDNFTHHHEKHNLNAPIIENFIERGLREYEF